MDTTGTRELALAQIEAYLRQRGIAFEVQRHPVAFTAQQVAEAEHVPGKLVAKVVVGIADGRPVMFAVPATRRVDFAEAAAVVGAGHVRLADERELAVLFPDCELGAMAPLGSLYNIRVYVDGALARDREIVFPAGTHAATIRMRYADFERVVSPTVAFFTRPL